MFQANYRNEADFQATLHDLARIGRWDPFHVPDSIRVTAKGFPDLVARHDQCGLLIVELKVGRNLPSPAQIAWLLTFQAAIPNRRVHLWYPRHADIAADVLAGRQLNRLNDCDCWVCGGMIMENLKAA